MSPVLAAFFCAATASSADNVKESPGFVMEIPEKESDVLPIVQDIAADSIIRGTYVYERDKELTGAMPAKSSNAFGQWQGPGQVFYKVVTGVLAPRHFLDSADVGTVTVRYVVEPAGEARTRVRIDAIFIEEGRRKAHRSDRTVESSEFKAIQDRVQQLQLAKQKTEEERQQAATNLKKREQEAAQRDQQLALRPFNPPHSDPRRMSHLIAIDVGRYPTALRQRYPEKQRFLIIRGVVRLFYQKVWDEQKHRLSGKGFLRGQIQVTNREIHVPLPHASPLASLPGNSSDAPRYVVTLRYGTRFEPWIAAVRRL